MGKIREGDKEALFVLYDDMYFHLIRYGLSEYADSDLVKDCIGQLFLKLWERHESLNDVENVQSYLFTSLRRLLQDYVGPINGGTQVYNEIMHANPVLFPTFYEPDEANMFTHHILFGNYPDEGTEYLNYPAGGGKKLITTSVYFQGILNYSKTFNNKHGLSGSHREDIFILTLRATNIPPIIK